MIRNVTFEELRDTINRYRDAAPDEKLAAERDAYRVAFEWLYMQMGMAIGHEGGPELTTRNVDRFDAGMMLVVSRLMGHPL